MGRTNLVLSQGQNLTSLSSVDDLGLFPASQASRDRNARSLEIRESLVNVVRTADMKSDQTHATKALDIE